MMHLNPHAHEDPPNGLHPILELTLLESHSTSSGKEKERPSRSLVDVSISILACMTECIDPMYMSHQ